MSEETQDKPFQASAEKLRKARERGNFPRSQDLLVAVAFLALCACFAILGQRITSKTQHLLEQLIRLSVEASHGGGTQFAKGVTIETLITISPIFAFPFAFVIVTLVTARMISFTPSNLRPKLNRISLVKGISRKFGLDGLFEFFKSALKLSVYTGAFLVILHIQRDNISSALLYDPRLSLVLMRELLLLTLAVAAVLTLIVGILDFVFSYFRFQTQNMMSRKELEDETKEHEGDPRFKMLRRQRALEMSRNKVADTATASVIVVNPTHFAVALKWAPESELAPIIVSKGVDEIALKIREIGQAHHVPIYEDPPTARSLYAVGKIGEPIPREYYAAIAEAIRFAQTLSMKGEQLK